MDQQSIALLQIAKLALAAVDLEVSPPPATEAKEPTPKLKANKPRKYTKRVKPEPASEPTPSGEPKRRGRPPRPAQQYICRDCERDFESKKPIERVRCEHCGSANIDTITAL